MNDRVKGGSAVVIGLILVVASLFGLINRGGDDATVAMATPSPSSVPSTAEPGVTPTRASATATPPPSTATAVAPTATPSPGPAAEALTIEWVQVHSTALAEADVETLMARLHPASLERYGEEQCRSYLSETLPSPALTLRQYVGLEPWNYDTDGLSEAFADAIAVEIERVVGGQTLIQEVHYVLVDGEIRWFTDCGEPVS